MFKELVELSTPKHQSKNTHGLWLSQEKVVWLRGFWVFGLVQEVSSQKECKPCFVKS